MKQKIIIMIMTAFSCITINAQNKIMNTSGSNKKATQQEENALGMRIFKALKEKSSDQWVLLYPTNDEYKELLQLMLAAKKDGLTRQKLDEMLAQRKTEADTAYKAEFQKFMKQANKLGISWKDAVYQI